MATLTRIFPLLIIIISLHIHLLPGVAKTLKITNNCTYEVWPAITSSVGEISASDAEYGLVEGDTRNVEVPTDWNGRVWGRTLCSNESSGNFTCLTGDCGTGFQCRSPYYSSIMPTTLIEMAFGQGTTDVYDVSVVDGYNIPVMVAPQGDRASTCLVTGCVFNLSGLCMGGLRVLSKNGTIIACRNPCADGFIGKDYVCCNRTSDCKPSNVSRSSLMFKNSCPRAYSYSEDDATSAFTCDSSSVSSYTIVFCPSTTKSRLFSTPFSQADQAIQPSASPSPQITRSPIPSSPATNLSVNPVPQRPSRNSSWWKSHASLIVGFSASAIFLILALIGILIYKRKTKATEERKDEMRRVMDALQYDLSTLRSATQNFAAENKLGEGGFGEVYKGKLENGQEIAVKRLSKNSGQGLAEFKTEIHLVAKLQHNNLVKLLGYCAAPKESLLVYEFLPNSSLDRLLFDPMKKASLEWKIRFRIILGIARGLLYLHEDSRFKVVHRDLKSSNILLDEAMNPKIADFGLARLFGVDQTQGDTKRIVGTYGYMAPEYAITGHYSAKSDVYSFGVIVLEIISGQRNRMFGRIQLEEALLHRAWRLWNEDEALDLVDTQLGGNFSEEQVLKCIQIGLLCIQENVVDRPRMTSIVAALSSQTVRLPTPKPPHFLGYAGDSDAPQTEDAGNVYSGSETITDVYSRN